MIKTIKKVLLSCVSVLGVSCLIWTFLFLNPSWSYANKTEFDFITVYHNEVLEPATESVLKDVMRIVEQSELYDEDFAIDLCLNNGNLYPKIYPFAGFPLAYAVLDKAIIKNCEIDFENNLAETKWAINNYEHRKFNLTWLLAHEITHNLQSYSNFNYYLRETYYINWKLEGHAEYVAREYKDDGELRDRIAKYLEEEQKEHNGLPVFDLVDGTKQILSYYKYSLVVQYLMDIKMMSFHEICELETDLETSYDEMLAWSNSVGM